MDADCTPEQVAEAIMKYYRLGLDSCLIRGFDPLNDVVYARSRI
jgi:alkanesulfonate monooxygenase